MTLFCIAAVSHFAEESPTPLGDLRVCKYELQDCRACTDELRACREEPRYKCGEVIQ